MDRAGVDAEVAAPFEAGFDGTPAEALAVWEADAEMWPSLGSPWRPSVSDTALYRGLAGTKLGGRVLVLGATPELRDLTAEAGAEPVVVEMSAAMHAATTRLLRRADPSRETWIHGDWCEVSIPGGGFDLVLGDMIWWGMSVSRQHAVRDTIHAALEPDGLFVSRFRFADTSRADEDAVSAIGRYLEQLERGPGDEKMIRGAMMSWIYDHTANRELHRLDLERARALVLSVATKPELSRHETFLRDLAGRLRGPNWTSQSREELLEIVGVRFELVQEERAEGYDSFLYPVIALRPTRADEPSLSD